MAGVSRSKSGLLAASIPQIGEFSFVLAGRCPDPMPLEGAIRAAYAQAA